MKRILLVLIILFVSILGLSCKEKEHKDWVTYTDEVLDFTIQYPTHWEKEFWKYGKDVESLHSQNFGRLAD